MRSSLYLTVSPYRGTHEVCCHCAFLQIILPRVSHTPFFVLPSSFNCSPLSARGSFDISELISTTRNPSLIEPLLFHERMPTVEIWSAQ
jgi:hypothetical protein